MASKLIACLLRHNIHNVDNNRRKKGVKNSNQIFNQGTEMLKIKKEV